MKRFTLLLLLAACSEEPDGTAATGQQVRSQQEQTSKAVGALPELPGEIKLVELLAKAEARSPLLVALDQDDAAIPGKPLLSLDFERQREAELGWKATPYGQILPRPDRAGHALAIRPSSRRPLGIVIPATPSAFYRVSRAIRGRPDAVELFVLEMSVVLEHKGLNHSEDLEKVLGTVTQAGSFVRLRALIGQRRFTGRSHPSAWHRDELVFFASPDTRSLLLVFQSLEHAGRNAVPVWFDDIAVETLTPTTKQRLALVRKRHAMPATRTPEALRAFGQFLPVPAATRAGPEDELAFEYRHGLIAPSPTSIRWQLVIPDRARMSLGLALLEESPPGTAVHCQVRVDDSVVLDEQIGEEWRKRWHDQDLDLSSFAGRRVVLELSASSPDGGIVVFSNPVIWQTRSSASRPNVYLVAVDTLRADRMSLYGFSRRTSPAIEALAKEGVTFDNVIAQSNWTPESFASIFTSQYSAQHGVTQRLSVLRRNEMAYALRQAGYFVHGIAFKLLLYDMGFERGFDSFFNVPKFHLAKSYTVRADDNWRRAEPWLAGHNERTSFLFYHLNDPHQPFNHQGESLTRFADTRVLEDHGLALPILISTKKVTYAGSKACTTCVKGGRFAPWFTQLCRGLYDGEVAYTDLFVGRFIDALKRHRLYDDSLILFLADHGEGLAEHEDFIGHGFHHLHDEQIHVPLLIKPPASSDLPRGRRVSAQVRLIDVLPTLLEMLDVESDVTCEGQSLVPLMRGEENKDRLAISENIHSQSIAVRDGRFKYILRYRGERPRERLYDLRLDPDENNDLAPKPSHREVFATLRQRAAEHLLRTQPGAWLLFVARPGASLDRVNLRLSLGSAQLQPIAGLLRGNSRGRGWRLERAKGESRLVALVRILSAPEKATWEVRLSRVTGKSARRKLPVLSAWRPASESKPFAMGKQGQLFAVHNPPHPMVEHKETISGEQLEALEALGYVK